MGELRASEVEASTPTSAAYQREGVVIYRGLLTPAATARIRRTIDDLHDRIDTLPPEHVYDLAPASNRPGRGIPAIRNILRLAPELNPEVAPLAREVGRRFLGRPVEVLWDAAVYMPPGRPDVESAWHQDGCVYSMTSRRAPKSMGYFWLALDDVEPSGGAIRFIPGSHQGPVLPHRWRNGDRKSGLETTATIDLSSMLSPALRAGDATFHHPYTLHGAGPNLSDRWRKGWVVGVGTPRLPCWLFRLRRSLSLRWAGGPA